MGFLFSKAAYVNGECFSVPSTERGLCVICGLLAWHAWQLSTENAVIVMALLVSKPGHILH